MTTTTKLDRKRDQQKLFSDFFLSQSKTTSSKRRKERELLLDFFSFLLKSESSRRRRQRKLSFDFFFSLNAQRTTTIWWRQILFDEDRNFHLIFIQSRLTDSRLVDTSRVELFKRFFIAKATARQASFNVMSRRAHRRRLRKTWTSWLRANASFAESHNAFIFLNVFS
jgi:hypothetical protein